MTEPPYPWRLLRFEEVPPGDDWLGPAERQRITSFARPGRQASFRAGRFAAKALLRAIDRGASEGREEPEGGGELAGWQVLAAPDGGPEAWRAGTRVATPVSISHRHGWAAAALGTTGAEIGVDLERVEPRTRRFVQDFFTEAEARRHADLPPDLRDLYAVTVWSAKECALKCARTGLRRDTRTVHVDLDLEVPPQAVLRPGWRRLGVYDAERDLVLEAWWSRREDLIVTLASARP